MIKNKLTEVKIIECWWCTQQL